MGERISLPCFRSENEFLNIIRVVFSEIVHCTLPTTDLFVKFATFM